MRNSITELNLEPGYILSGKYEVVRKLGKGWEGEVYSISELETGVERAAKIFYPKRNPKNKTAKLYAKKLHKLRRCNILMQYLTQEKLRFRGNQYSYLISEFIEGETLLEFLKRCPGKRMHPYQALHLLHALCKGIEEIHLMKEYHGDLHPENVMIQGYGLEFDLKVIDMFHWGASSRANQLDDLFDMITIFYQAIGGQKHYSKSPDVVKEICCGLKKSLISKKFRSVSHLKAHLETLTWGL